MRGAIEHDEVNEVVTVSYPIIGDIRVLKDNRYQVIGMAKSLEKRLSWPG